MSDLDEFSSVYDRNSFLVFLKNLSMDFEENPGEWQNQRVSDYLKCIAAWIEDWGAKYGTAEFDNLDFHEMAKILYMGKIYE